MGAQLWPLLCGFAKLHHGKALPQSLATWQATSRRSTILPHGTQLWPHCVTRAWLSEGLAGSPAPWPAQVMRSTFGILLSSWLGRLLAADHSKDCISQLLPWS